MHNDSFPFAHLVIHLIVILLAGSQRTARRERKTVRRRQQPKPVCVMPPGFRLRTNRDRGVAKAKGNTMKPLIRYRSQLLFRKSYKPSRVIRIRPAQKAALVVRPARAGPQINTYEYATD
jgi:hypothetical protein